MTAGENFLNYKHPINQSQPKQWDKKQIKIALNTTQTQSWHKKLLEGADGGISKRSGGTE